MRARVSTEALLAWADPELMKQQPAESADQHQREQRAKQYASPDDHSLHQDRNLADTEISRSHPPWAYCAGDHERNVRSVSLRSMTKQSGAGIGARARSFRVDSFILAVCSRPVRSDKTAPQRAQLPLAPQKAAEDAADPKSQNRTEAHGGHEKPPDQAHATAHGIGSSRSDHGHVAKAMVGER